jgi:hypothetical protein
MTQRVYFKSLRRSWYFWPWYLPPGTTLSTVTVGVATVGGVACGRARALAFGVAGDADAINVVRAIMRRAMGLSARLLARGMVTGGVFLQQLQEVVSVSKVQLQGQVLRLCNVSTGRCDLKVCINALNDSRVLPQPILA